MQDLKLAIRTLSKTPAFTIVAILTIAIGMGADATLYSIFDRPMLFETQPFDPAIYALVAPSFAVVALLACVLPTMRAAKIDPIAALRSE